MKGKVKICALVLLAGITMNSKAFAVTYTPFEEDESVYVDKIEVQEDTYTQDDVSRIISIYLNDEEISEEMLDKYDLNKDGKINANDAALIYDLMK